MTYYNSQFPRSQKFSAPNAGAALNNKLREIDALSQRTFQKASQLERQLEREKMLTIKNRMANEGVAVNFGSSTGFIKLIKPRHSEDFESAEHNLRAIQERNWHRNKHQPKTAKEELFIICQEYEWAWVIKEES